MFRMLPCALLAMVVPLWPALGRASGPVVDPSSDLGEIPINSGESTDDGQARSRSISGEERAAGAGSSARTGPNHLFMGASGEISVGAPAGKLVSIFGVHALFAATDSLRIGGSFYQSIGVLNGMEGCSTVLYCLHNARQLGGRMELHFGPQSTFDGWIGVEPGLEVLVGDNRPDWVTYTKHTAYARLLAGFDLQAVSPQATVGAGLLIGALIDDMGAGFLVGARMNLGFL